MRERIEIVVSQRGAREVSRNINDIGRTSRRTHSSVDLLKRGLQALGGLFAVREVGRAVDRYNALNNRLSVVSGSVSQVSNSYNALLEIANRTLVPLEESVVLFQRASIAADQLGASNQDLFKFVETVGQALSIQGGSAQTARGALLQLSQAIGTDIVRAEEFNSILEGAFPIALAAARGIDEASGSISRLRNMVIEGEVTSKQFFEAIMSQSDALAEQFSKITPTMAQGFNVLENGWITYIGRVDEAIGVSQTLAQTMIWMGQNMDEVGAIAAGTGTTLLVAFSPRLITQMRRGTNWLGRFMLAARAHPVLALISALAGATVYMTAFRDEISLGTDDLKTAGDLFSVFADDIAEAAPRIADALIGPWVGPAIDAIKEYVSQFDLSLVGMLRSVADFVDDFVGVYIGAFKAILAVWNEFPNAFVATIRNAIQPAAQLFEDFTNTAISGINKIREFGGLDPVELVAFDLADPVDGNSLGDLGRIAGEAFMEGFEGSTSVRDYLEGAVDRASGRMLRRQYEEYMNRPRDEGARGLPLADELEDNSKEADKLANSLRRVITQYDQVAGAAIELSEVQSVLNRATAAGLISQARAVDLYERAEESLRAQLDPMGAMIDEMREEAELLRMLSTEREVATRLREAENDLRKAGLRLSQDQVDSLEREIRAMRQLEQLSGARDDILQSVNGTQREYNLRLTALNSLLMDGELTLEQYNKQFEELQQTLPEASNALDTFAENAARNIQDVLADFLFDPFENGMEGMLQTFSTVVRRMVAEAVAADLTRRLFGASGGGTGGGLLGSLVGAASSFFGFGGAPIKGGFMTQLPSMHGGGYTGDMPRTGGLDGKGGFLMVGHPQETVTDHTQKSSGPGGTTQYINNTFVLEQREDRRTQQQVSLAASEAQRRANARFGG